MSKAEVSLEHLFKVFTKPEHNDSTLAKIERHLSDNVSDFLSQHVVAQNTSLEEIEQDFMHPGGWGLGAFLGCRWAFAAAYPPCRRRHVS